MNPYPLLDNAPAHDSPEFIDYLRENNMVVAESSDWIVIENCKYHTPERAWYTAFAKVDSPELPLLNALYADWEWRKKPAHKQSVKRLHLHLIRDVVK